MGSFQVYTVVVMLLLSRRITGQNIKFLLVTESAQQNLNNKFSEGLKLVQDANSGSSLDVRTLNFTRKGSEEAYNDMCGLLSSGGFSAVVDMSWGGWVMGRQSAAEMGVPYIRVESANHPFVQAADDFLKARDAVDAALIFQNQLLLDQSLYYIIGNSFLRIIGAHMDDMSAFERLKMMRPRPSNYVAWGTKSQAMAMYQHAKYMDMVKRDTRWTLVFDDFDSLPITSNQLGDQTNIIQLKSESCCILLDKTVNCDCKYIDPVTEVMVRNSAKLLGEATLKMAKAGKSGNQAWTCGQASTSNQTKMDFDTYVKNHVSDVSKYKVIKDSHGTPYLVAPLTMDVSTINKTKTVNVGTWSHSDGFVQNPAYTQKKIKRFFRVGIVLGLPWAWVDGAKDPTDVSKMSLSLPNSGVKGYCIDLLTKLSELMDFDYEIVPSSKNMYGHKLANGSWSGIVGDLIAGDIDISVAALTMTTEREEFIDFVAPYFDQSGISILLRKKQPKQSIFKFMTVLKYEVWFGILAAVFVVTFLIWALDRFSPYSYHNNKAAYPQGARDFTLGESLWFSLTSLTPQGGGECPKALSTRVLVAAYWLFIVLMLATFTANLAAFLTVERMQTSVQSLEELARQSRINYTVVESSPYMEYFLNMAGAEEELYKKWKEITLNSSSDQSKYRVWDYPVREQYTHILKVIQQTGPVNSPEEGWKKVEEHLEGDFAFIHDASEVRYQFYGNCNFTEVGEPFAEQPLAVAVQQGSHLQKEISKTILTLQKERYFEQLSSTYWSNKKRSTCPVLDDSRGITLKSLGGIFLATFCGLFLSMLTLAYEVWQQKKQNKNQVTTMIPSSSSTNAKIVNVGNKQIRLSAGGGPNGKGMTTISAFT